MLKSLRIKIGRYFAREDIALLEERTREAETSANQRVAKIIASMDPLEPLLKQYNVIFSKEYEFPESKLDPRGQLGMYMWGYQQNNDPYFGYMTDWIMNTAGNETMKRAPITSERTQYGRAQIANMVLFKQEVGRLASLYEDMLAKKKRDDFDEDASVE